MKYITTAALAFFATASVVAQSPKIEFPDGATVDVGLIDSDVMVSDTIRITNAGDAPLSIYTASSDCSCTSIKYPKEAIAPGDTVSLKVSFDTKGRFGGGFMKIVRLRTNDPVSQHNIYVKGEVKRPAQRVRKSIER